MPQSLSECLSNLVISKLTCQKKQTGGGGGGGGVCVCACVHARVWVCVFRSIHREGFICLDQLGCQGTDQRCCVEDVGFFWRFSLLLFWNAEPNLSFPILFVHQKRAQPQLNQYTSRFQNIGHSFAIIRRRLRYALHRDLRSTFASALTRGFAICL